MPDTESEAKVPEMPDFGFEIYTWMYTLQGFLILLADDPGVNLIRAPSLEASPFAPADNDTCSTFIVIQIPSGEDTY